MQTQHPNATGVFIISCIPLAAILAVLVAAGETGVGFMVPAITCGVVIGMLVFMLFWDGPPRLAPRRGPCGRPPSDRPS